MSVGLLWCVCLLLLVAAAPSHTAGGVLNFHLWDSLQIEITQPTTLRGNITYNPAEFGNSILVPPGSPGVDIELVLAWPDFLACDDLRGADGQAHTIDGRSYEGKIMLILRGDCTFGRKSAVAQLAGAAMVMIYSCSPLAPSLCSADRVDVFSADSTVTIPTMMITWWDGDRLSRSLTSCLGGAADLTGMTSQSAAFSSSAHLTVAPAFVEYNPNCSIWLRIPGTGPIHPDDRAALTEISRDFDFRYLADGSSQSGPLPSFATIVNATWDACVSRIAGVYCIDGRIVILNLERMNITGVLSPAIGKLTALQQLVLSSNNFYCTTLPCSFRNLTQLRVLSLFHMGLESFEPLGETCLDTLTNLEFLDASFNKIVELTRSMLAWSSLQALVLQNNAIVSELGPEEFRVFRQLTYLSLGNNQIFLDVTGLAFSELTNIQSIQMANNLVQGVIGPHAFDNMPLLMTLDLSHDNDTPHRRPFRVYAAHRQLTSGRVASPCLCLCCLLLGDNHLLGRLPLFQGTNSLVHLDLSGNEFEGNCSMWKMPQLLYLSLSTNLLTESQENLPTAFQSLLYMDFSNNALTMPPGFTDIGAFLFSFLPLPLQTIHLEYNAFDGTWGTGFLQTYPQLSHVYLSHNLIRAIPDDIFQIGDNAIIDLDLSYNELVGSLPSVPPPPPTTSIKFEGNTNLFDPDRQLPVWVMADPDGGYYAPSVNSSFSCPGLVGTTNHLSVSLDPSYFGYSGCECNRGTYGLPPDCIDIPAVLDETVNQSGQGSFTDALFGSKRFFQGVDTSFVLGMYNLSDKIRHDDEEDGNGDTILARPVWTMHSNPDGSISGVLMSDAGESDGSDPNPDPPIPPTMPIVRAIYITFQLNLDEFSSVDDSITVYAGGLDLRGDRVVLWQGTDGSYAGNIPLDDMYPPLTVTILDSRGIVNFRSRHASGTHFKANFTLSPNCPPGYEITVDPVHLDGYCSLPPGPSSNGSIILLLVTSVIIGVLALCLLGQKMSTIQGLINGTSLGSGANPHRSRRAQAQEIYGPVLSVEDSWRRQLKRDILKEVLMFGLDVIGYLSNWIVVIQQVQGHVGSVFNDKFLVAYCFVVVCSTVTGSVSVFTRVRVIREIYRELKIGLAVVPTIDMLLNQMKAGNGKPKRVDSASDISEKTITAHSFGARGRGKNSSNQLAASFGRPLLSDAHIDSAGDQPIPASVSGAATSIQHPTGFAVNIDKDHSLDGSFESTIHSSASHRPHRRAASPALSHASHSHTSGELKVRLSSRDPNVQLAWVQRSISTTRLTSFNLIFSTLPFLVLNQVRIFTDGDIKADWALQLSSLFAAMLIGVKLLRILALGELLQRRNELVFEVIVAGSGSIRDHRLPRMRDDSSLAADVGVGSSRNLHAHDGGTVAGSAASHSVAGIRSQSFLAHSGPHTLTNNFSPRGAAFSHGANYPPHAMSVDAAIPEGLLPDSFAYGSSHSLVSSDHDGFGSSSGESAACDLIAPATSFAAPPSGTLTDDHTISYDQALYLDEASEWARDNQGSELQLHNLPAHPTRFGEFGFASDPGLIHSHDSSSASNSTDSRTTSRGDAASADSGNSWIHSHMLADMPPPTTTQKSSPSATKLEKLVKSNSNQYE